MSDKQAGGLAAAVKNTLDGLGRTFAAFLKAPRALWGINIPYVFEGLVYFGILTILGKFCSENVALNDVHSGWVYGGVTGGITLAMLLFGGVSDKIGVRVSLALALLVMMLGRILVALSGTLSLGSGVGSPMFLLMAAGLLLMVAAYGLYMPAAYAGVKRYTNPQTAAIGYAVIYGLMNLGAFLSGFVSANTRHAFVAKFPPNGLTAVFWIYSGITLFGSLLTMLIISRKVNRQAVERVARETRQMNTAEQNLAADAKAAAGKKVEARVPMGIFYAWLVIDLAALALLILSRLGKVALPGSPLYALLALASLGTIWEFLRRRPQPPLPRRALRIFYLHPHSGADPVRPQLADHPLLPGPCLRRHRSQPLLRGLFQPQSHTHLCPLAADRRPDSAPQRLQDDDRRHLRHGPAHLSARPGTQRLSFSLLYPADVGG